MIATQNPDHVAQGIALLVEQFKATVDLPKYLAVYLRQNQILEGVIWDVINKRMLGVAVGISWISWEISSERAGSGAMTRITEPPSAFAFGESIARRARTSSRLRT